MQIGIIGAGQLGQMLGFAARELGHESIFIDPSDTPPAARAGKVVRAQYDDDAALAALAEAVDVVTYEFENVPVAALAAIPDHVPVYPPTRALEVAQDRLSEKTLFEALDIPVPPFRTVDTEADLAAACGELGFPCVLKTRRFGYDGKGQAVIRDAAGMAAAWSALGGQPLILEAWVPFDHEVSVIGARTAGGGTCTWPLTRNRHRDGILRTSLAPSDEGALNQAARAYIDRLLADLDYVGVLALELFVSGGSLLANEFAPRVHNSGHWTIEGSATSQFANHVRAITGAELGTADCRGYAGMVNLIGEIPDAARQWSDPRVFFHDYGKSPRPGRKLGHLTVVADTEAARDDLVARLAASAA
jgi:5-(carboxyamino)imidazole ribonucleotide synthase